RRHAAGGEHGAVAVGRDRGVVGRADGAAEGSPAAQTTGPAGRARERWRSGRGGVVSSPTAVTVTGRARMSTLANFVYALDHAELFEACGMVADEWQKKLLRSHSRRLALCCSRQSGKSTVVSALALATALYTDGSLVLLLSPTARQSSELLRSHVYRLW